MYRAFPAYRHWCLYVFNINKEVCPVYPGQHICDSVTILFCDFGYVVVCSEKLLAREFVLDLCIEEVSSVSYLTVFLQLTVSTNQQ